ncbi:MAG TPA: hypothetical protein VLF93_01220 [Candidatus Saccharimonadales bacterium]|nr:hypothetical protein [Candidatus Saccharimonadales bacterium]
MQPLDPTKENQELNNLIKKHITIFGPDITFAQLGEIKGLEVDVDGTILKINGDQQQIEKQLRETWTILSPFLAKKMLLLMTTS